MLFEAHNGSVSLPGGEMDYIRFGRGERVLIILPGLGDGLKTVRGTALPMAWMYRCLAKEYTVYAFSRRNDLLSGVTTVDMAADAAAAMDLLGIRCADILGVSMGGMIAQHLAAGYPDRVRRLVLAVTSPGPDPSAEKAVNHWIRLAQAGDHTAFMESNLRLIYSDSYYRRNRWILPILGLITKPGSYERFMLQADACLTHDARSRLNRITAPTLVIGGEQDQVISPAAAAELAAGIPGARLHVYPQWGHGLYEEAGDFLRVVQEFLEN